MSANSHCQKKNSWYQMFPVAKTNNIQPNNHIDYNRYISVVLGIFYHLSDNSSKDFIVY